MGPLIAREARDAPKHAKRLNRTGSFRLAHIGGFTAELAKDFAHRFSGWFVVAADEHRWLPAFELRVHHAPRTHRIEGLDKACLRKLALKPLHQGLVKICKKPQHAVYRRQIRDRIGGVNDRLSRQVRGGCETQRIGGDSSLDRQDDQIRKRTGVPVVDGVAAAVTIAESLVRLGLSTSKVRTFEAPRPKKLTGWPLG